ASVLLFALAAHAHETTAPVLLKRVDPIYPQQALDAGVEGTVVLELHIDAKGAVEHVHVLSSPGFGLDEASIVAAKQFQFKPATEDHVPVATKVAYEQRFAISRMVRGDLVAEPTTPGFVEPISRPELQTYVIVERAPLSSASASAIRDQDFEL